MKKFKILVLFMAISAITFYSCSDNESIENQAETKKSTALRVVLNEFKKANNISGRSASNDAFCFEFVYPLTLSYNTGTVVTVASFDGLVSLLSNENEQVYISGIAFPFQVVLLSDNTTTTINNEQDLWNIIDGCNFTTYDDYVFNSLCYDFVFPLSFVTENNQIITVANQQELFDLFVNPNQSNLIYDFSYPFSVIYESQTVVINNEYEFYQMNSNCDPNIGCICPAVYAPVCVQTAAGIVAFSNSCEAECAGYTTADFVNCNSNNGNGFDGLGTCFTIQYPVQVQYQGALFTVNDDNELFSYLNTPNGGATINYPIVIVSIPTPSTPSITFTINNESGLNDVTAQICN
jgi:hypothetical protein